MSSKTEKEASPRKLVYEDLKLGNPYGRECDTCGFPLMPFFESTKREAIEEHVVNAEVVTGDQ